MLTRPAELRALAAFLSLGDLHVFHASIAPASAAGLLCAAPLPEHTCSRQMHRWKEGRMAGVL